MESLKPKVLVTFGIIDEVFNKLKEKVDVVLYWNTDVETTNLPREVLERWIGEVDGIICNGPSCKVDEALLSKAPKLKVVSTVSVGVDHIDLEACARRGVRVGYTPDVLNDTVADLVIAILLAAARRIPEGVNHVKKGTWPTVWAPLWMCGKDLHHSTVGIVGMGRIGARVAKRLHGFDCTVLYPDRRDVPEVRGIATMVPLDELYARSDFVIVLTPLTDSTRGMINMDVFKKMKNDAFLVNVSRGAVVNQEDLVTAIRENIIGGAALDVTSPEPLPPSHPLLAPDLASRITITPHLGSASVATRTTMSLRAVDNLLAALEGHPMPILRDHHLCALSALLGGLVTAAPPTGL